MNAEIHIFSCLRDNIGALVFDPETGACAAIDAPEEAPILQALEEKGWHLSDILVTHKHSDHIGGIPALKARFGCRVTVPARMAQASFADRSVAEGDMVAVGTLEAKVWETPGHTLDHVAYWFESAKAIFAGDTLFALGCGKVLEGSYAQMGRSVGRFQALPGETRLYCGHDYALSNARFALAVEPDNAALKRRQAEAQTLKEEGGLARPSTVAAECDANPFLRLSQPAIRQAVGLKQGSDEAVFQALRQWKNRF